MTVEVVMRVVVLVLVVDFVAGFVLVIIALKKTEMNGIKQSSTWKIFFIPCACRCRRACDSYPRKHKCHWFIYRQKHGKFSFLNMTHWAGWTHIPSIIPWFNVQLRYCFRQSSRHLFVWQLSVFNMIEFRCANLHVACAVEIQQVHLHLKLPAFEWTRRI